MNVTSVQALLVVELSLEMQLSEEDGINFDYRSVAKKEWEKYKKENLSDYNGEVEANVSMYVTTASGRLLETMAQFYSSGKENA